MGVRITAFTFALVLMIALIYQPASAAENDLQGRVVILDAGHGAGNVNGYAGYEEHSAMLGLALKIKPLLEERGATVLMTRPSATNVTLPVRVGLINKWALEAVREAKERELLQAQGDNADNADSANYANNADNADNANNAAQTLQNELNELDRLIDIMKNVISFPEAYAPTYFNYPFDYSYRRTIHPDLRKVFEYQNDPEIRSRFLMISLHSNATGKPINTSANGADVFYSTNTNRKNTQYYANYSYVAPCYHFGTILLDKIETIGIRKRSVVEEHWFMIREINIPCVLVENGFHTNAGDRALLSSDVFMNSLAQVYVDSIAEYFISYIGPLPHTGETDGEADSAGIPEDGETAPDAITENASAATASEWMRENIIDTLAQNPYLATLLLYGILRAKGALPPSS